MQSPEAQLLPSESDDALVRHITFGQLVYRATGTDRRCAIVCEKWLSAFRPENFRHLVIVCMA